MRIADRLALSRFDRELRRLQRAYYDATIESDQVIVEYLRTLENARSFYLSVAGASGLRRKVHLGAGGHRIRGWINIDVDPAMPVDLAADLRSGMPLRTESVDLIHSEDFLEHINHQDGQRVIAECHRVLRQGGVMRLLTPDVRAIVRKVYVGRDARHLQWCADFLGAATPCEALNMHMRMNGDHRFLYDYDELTRLLRGTGFVVRRVSYNHSTIPELRYLDLRDFGLNLFVECLKKRH